MRVLFMFTRKASPTRHSYSQPPTRYWQESISTSTVRVSSRAKDHFAALKHEARVNLRLRCFLPSQLIDCEEKTGSIAVRGFQMTLDSLNRGEAATVHSIDGGDPVLRNRLFSLGIIPGNDISVCHFAPLGDPMTVRCGQTRISLRKSEARHITVLPLKED